MLTSRSIYRFFSVVLIICSVGALSVSLYTNNWYVFLVWSLFCMLLFPIAFVMEWFHISIADPILWAAARLTRKTAKSKAER